jgi:hypothetical protein
MVWYSQCGMLFANSLFYVLICLTSIPQFFEVSCSEFDLYFFKDGHHFLKLSFARLFIVGPKLIQ